MCLIMTVFAAVAATIVWYFKLNDRKYKMGTLALMYWGASAMWFVDCIFSAADGEKFFNLSLNDAILGLVIIAAGLIVWLICLLFNDPKHIFLQTKERTKNE